VIKKKIGKLIIAIVSSCLTILFLTSYFVKASSDIREGQAIATTIEELKNKYNLEDIEKVPEGIIPLKFDTLEDLDKYLTALNSHDYLKAESFISPSDKSVKTLLKSAGKLNNDVSLNVTCSYTICSNSIIKINSVSSYIVGNTGNWEWNQTTYNKQILDDGRTVGITVVGILTQHTIIDGAEKTFDTTVSAYAEFSK